MGFFKKVGLAFSGFDGQVEANIINAFNYLEKEVSKDNLIKFHKWKNWKLLLKLTEIVVFSRKDYDKKAKKSVIMRLVKKIIFINNKPINISSTQVRKKLL